MESASAYASPEVIFRLFIGHLEVAISVQLSAFSQKQPPKNVRACLFMTWRILAEDIQKLFRSTWWFVRQIPEGMFG